MRPDAWPGPSRLHRLDWLLLLVVGLLSSAWCLTASRELGPTFDEPFYLEAGLDFWRTGNPRELLAAGTMPLSTHLQTLPLYLMERASGRSWIWADHVSEMLTVARSVTLLFWWVLLYYALRLGHALGGLWAGRLSLSLLGFEPNFLAHAGLATTDLSLAACLMAFVYHFRAGRERGWRLRVGVPALLFALAILAKSSALVFGPLAMVLVELERLARNGAFRGTRGWRGRVVGLWRDSRDARWDGLTIGAMGVLLAVAYCGSGGGPSFQNTLAHMPADRALRPLLAWIGGLPLFPNGLYAIWFQADHNLTGQPTFLVGYENARSLWFYLPVLMAIKMPLALIVLLAGALVARGPRVKMALGLVAIVLAIAVVMRVHTGIRLVLPLLGFVIVGIAARISHMLATLSESRRRIGVGLVASLVAWLLVGDLRVWPDAVRYTNEIWGDTERGYLFVSDSNYDWGQGLPELAAWRQRQSGPVAVWYFGADPRYPALARYDPSREGVGQPVPEGGFLAVGTTLLYGGYKTGGAGRDLILRLRARTPVTRTRTFLIFDSVAP